MQADVHVSYTPGRAHNAALRVRQLDVPLTADADAPARARRAVGELLRGWSPERRETALLIVSELVTNAVRHGSAGPEDSIRVRVDHREHKTRIEVADRRARGGAVRAAASAHEAGAVAGWGLPIVTELTDRWGVESKPSSTRVWCELDAV
jgi:anti-sigma regulatory factor (Ser/Thr protein kinase)